MVDLLSSPRQGGGAFLFLFLNCFDDNGRNVVVQSMVAKISDVACKYKFSATKVVVLEALYFCTRRNPDGGDVVVAYAKPAKIIQIVPSRSWKRNCASAKVRVLINHDAVAMAVAVVNIATSVHPSTCAIIRHHHGYLGHLKVVVNAVAVAIVHRMRHSGSRMRYLKVIVNAVTVAIVHRMRHSGSRMRYL